MSTFNFNIEEPFYTAIKNKRKIYEIRANDAKRQAIKPGDIIEFKRDEASLLKTIVRARTEFPTLEAAINSVPHALLQATLEQYQGLPGLYQKVEAMGAVLFQIELHPDEKRYAVFH